VPIYAYRCTECGHAEDTLQKMSAAPLTTCPACGKSTYAKQVTAAGFQLKGSGWYVTDFRDNTKKSDETTATSSAATSGAAAAPAAAVPAENSKSEAKPSAPASAPAATPASSD